MADLSTTAASNYPTGSDSPTSGDDYFRSIQAIIRSTNAKGADIASATTTDIGAATGEFVDVTGTTTITGLGTIAAGIVRTVRFTGALTLTHNATSLILPGSANITTENGDVAQFRSLGSGNWQCVGYSKAAGYAKSGANSDITSLTGLTTQLSESQGGTGTTTGLYGFKNRIINGQFQIAQRATSATITAGSTIAAGYSTVDRFYVYCTGANVTAAQVAGTVNTKNRFQITGAASVTAVGIGQRIEQLNSYDLAGETATLSVDISNSLLTSVTWTAYYANTADTFGTLASPTRTQIATGTFTVTSTLTNYSTQISMPAAATTGIEIVLSVGAQTSGTWVIGNIQLEKGASKTGFDYRSYGTELALCQRYLWRGLPATGFNFASYTTNSIMTWSVKFAKTMFATPTITLDSTGASLTSVASITVNSPSPDGCNLLATANAVTNNARFAFAAGNYIQAVSEL
jgi:hypothetical protein